jgi:hypothetical protein
MTLSPGGVIGFFVGMGIALALWCYFFGRAYLKAPYPLLEVPLWGAKKAIYQFIAGIMVFVGAMLGATLGAIIGQIFK